VSTFTGPQGNPGDDGRDVQFQKSPTHIQWRYAGEALWTDLVALADITGSQGPEGEPGTDAPADYSIQVALSPNATNISSGNGKGWARVPFAGTITAVHASCDPSNEPSAIAVQVDVNKVDRATGTATSVLSSVASIATGGNAGSGTVNGTQTVEAGDLLRFDVDQGSDGKELTATVIILRT
jgi:hypothetical protein